MKKFKKLITPIIIIILIIAIIWFYQRSIRTVYNEEHTVGNTAGNLFNEGLFRELNGNIYFSNPKDEGALYVTDLDFNKYKKLSTDKVYYINASGNYIYYSRRNNEKEKASGSILEFNNVGIYRISLKGKDIKMLHRDASGLLNVYGNYLYFQNYNTKELLSFQSVKIDGTEEYKISEEPILPISIEDNILYYAGTLSEHNINQYNLKTGDFDTVYEGNCYAPIRIGNYIYFMSQGDNYTINRVNIDGSNPTLVVNERCSTYNITEDGKYLYYQVDNNSNNRICRMNLQTGESDTLMKGDFKQIHITSKYVFFNDFLETNTYYLPISSSSGISTFQPPVIGK